MNMTRFASLLRASLAATALALAACASPINGPEAAFNPMLRFPINVEPRMATLHIAYDRGVDQGANAQLARFAKDYLDRGAGSIAVSASPAQPQAPSEIAERLVSYGIPRNKILIGNQDTFGAAGDVKISYIRYEADAPACGNWSVNLGDVSSNKPSPNFGCATQHNLAAQVADPRDLVSPWPLDPDDSTRRLTVLDKYRKGESTISEKTAAQSGAVSTVAAGGGGGGGM
jgi:pilus assembly protein CpaD